MTLTTDATITMYAGAIGDPVTAISQSAARGAKPPKIADSESPTAVQTDRSRIGKISQSAAGEGPATTAIISPNMICTSMTSSAETPGRIALNPTKGSVRNKKQPKPSTGLRPIRSDNKPVAGAVMTRTKRPRVFERKESMTSRCARIWVKVGVKTSNM